MEPKIFPHHEYPTPGLPAIDLNLPVRKQREALPVPEDQRSFQTSSTMPHWPSDGHARGACVRQPHRVDLHRREPVPCRRPLHRPAAPGDCRGLPAGGPGMPGPECATSCAGMAELCRRPRPPAGYHPARLARPGWRRARDCRPGDGRHRTHRARKATGTYRALRRPDRHAQPRTAGRPPVAGTGPRQTRPGPARGMPSRPGRLQGGDRRLRSRGRRPSAGGGYAAHQGNSARRRHGGPPRRRRIRRAAGRAGSHRGMRGQPAAHAGKHPAPIDIDNTCSSSARASRGAIPRTSGMRRPCCAMPTRPVPGQAVGQNRYHRSMRQATCARAPITNCCSRSGTARGMANSSFPTSPSWNCGLAAWSAPRP